MSANTFTDATSPIPVPSVPTPLRAWVAWAVDSVLYRAEQAEHRYARSLGPVIAIAAGFTAAITIGLCA